MKKITDLKANDKIYDIDLIRIRHYRYLCVHPIGGGNYHILIDENEERIRIYCEKLQDILNKDYKTRQEANLALADSLEKTIERLRKEDKPID